MADGRILAGAGVARHAPRVPNIRDRSGGETSQLKRRDPRIGALDFLKLRGGLVAPPPARLILCCVRLDSVKTRYRVEYTKARLSGALKDKEIADGVCINTLDDALARRGLEAGWAAMPAQLPGHGKCVCIVYKPGFELMAQATRLARARAV